MKPKTNNLEELDRQLASGNARASLLVGASGVQRGSADGVVDASSLSNEI